MNNRQERNRSRREFLAQTAACLTAMPSARALGQQGSTEDAWNLERRLILASHLFEDGSFFEIGRYFRDLIPQSRQIDLWIDYAGNRTSRHFDEIRARGFAATRAYCDQLGIRLSTATCYGSRGYAGYAEAIRDLGCTLCIQSSGKRSSGSITEMMKRELESYKPALELAEKYDCRIAIENHSGRHLLNEMDSFKAFMDLCEHSVSDHTISVRYCGFCVSIVRRRSSRRSCIERRIRHVRPNWSDLQSPVFGRLTHSLRRRKLGKPPRWENFRPVLRRSAYFPDSGHSKHQGPSGIGDSRECSRLSGNRLGLGLAQRKQTTMNVNANLKVVLCLVCVLSALGSMKAGAETPLSDASYLWQMSDNSNAATPKAHLEVHGAVQFGVPLNESEQAASLVRGGDGKAARFEGGYLALADEAELAINPKQWTIAVRLSDTDGKWLHPILGSYGSDKQVSLALRCRDARNMPLTDRNLRGSELPTVESWFVHPDGPRTVHGPSAMLEVLWGATNPDEARARSGGPGSRHPGHPPA